MMMPVIMVMITLSDSAWPSGRVSTRWPSSLTSRSEGHTLATAGAPDKIWWRFAVFLSSIWEFWAGKKFCFWIGETFTEDGTIKRLWWRRQRCCRRCPPTKILWQCWWCQRWCWLPYQGKYYDHDVGYQGEVRFRRPPHALGPSCQVLAGQHHLVITIIIDAIILIEYATNCVMMSKPPPHEPSSPGREQPACQDPPPPSRLLESTIWVCVPLSLSLH